MRPTLWLALIGLCFGAFLVRQASVAAPKPPPIPKPKETTPVAAFLVRQPPAAVDDGKRANVVNRTEAPSVFEATAEGFGETEESARKWAVEDACDRVARFLNDQGETDYRPTVERLRDLRIVPSMEDIEVKDVTLKNLGPTKQATLKLKVLPDQLKTMQSEARHLRAEQRQHCLGFGLAGVVALLLVAIGVLRLEEALKGYYTYVLLFSALSVLSAVTVFLWYVS